jgi:drug/metabolite transporter (DMT)-like permease
MGFFAGGYIVQYIGLSLTTGIHQSIISNTQTFWVVVFNLLFFHQKPKKIFMLGAACAFVGTTLVLANSSLSFTSLQFVGDLISLVAFMLWGGYTAFTKPLSTKANPFHITCSIILNAIIIMIPLSFFVGEPMDILKLTWSQWLIILYLGIFCIGLAFILYSLALSDKSLPSENISLMTMLNPIVGIIASILLLGEVLTLSTFIGSILVFIGLFLGNLKSKTLQNP